MGLVREVKTRYRMSSRYNAHTGEGKRKKRKEKKERKTRKNRKDERNMEKETQKINRARKQ